jgi:Flp pilus assembly protein TadD
VIYKNANMLDEAIAYYRKALECNPNFEIARSNLAIALTDLGTKVKAEGSVKRGIQLYKEALVYHPQYANAFYNLGVAYGEQHRYDRALLFYSLAIQFNQFCCEAYNNMGVILKDQDNLVRAISSYKQALRINPKFSQTLNNLAVVYTVQGDVEKARTHLEQALAVNPEYAEAYNNLGVLYVLCVHSVEFGWFVKCVECVVCTHVWGCLVCTHVCVSYVYMYAHVCMYIYICVCVCACMRERENVLSRSGRMSTVRSSIAGLTCVLLPLRLSLSTPLTSRALVAIVMKDALRRAFLATKSV